MSQQIWHPVRRDALFVKGVVFVSLMLGGFFFSVASVNAATIIWDDGGGDGAWETSTNWSGDTIPGSGDDVIIDTGVTVTLNGSTTINSLTIASTTIATSSTLTFNYDAQEGDPLIVSGDLTIHSSGTLTHTANGTTQAYTIDIEIGGDLIIDSGGAIDVTGKGYAGNGQGPGGGYDGSFGGSGGAYGGDGGDGSVVGGTAYGSTTNPVQLGSGGGQSNGDNGGGLAVLLVTGSTTINGSLLADGDAGNGGATAGGGGAGGGINITTGGLEGTGAITAHGGDGGNGTGSYDGGGGGGGRIAIAYTYGTTTSLSTLAAYGGYSIADEDGAAGTIYTKSGSQTYGDLLIDNNSLSTSVANTPLDATDTFIELQNITLSANAVVESGGDAYVYGNFFNNATFSNTSGTTTFTGVSQQFATGTGAYTFYNLVVDNTSQSGSTTQSIVFVVPIESTNEFTITGSSSVQFMEGGTYTFQDINWAGSAVSPIYLRSSLPNAQWGLNVNGTQVAVDYVDARDSDATLSTGGIDQTNSTDSGNNINWNGFEGEIFGVEWNATDWTLYDTITIDATQVDDDLTDFPVYVDLSDLSSQFWSTTPSAPDKVATDIRVTTASTSPTELPRELVFASSTAQTGELHFKADSISSTTDTVFRIYYNGTTTGDYAADQTYGAQNVWSNGYVVVYHMNEDPSVTTIVDSTRGGTHATSYGSMTSDDLVSSQIGYGIDFDGGGDYMLAYPDLPEADYSFSAWVDHDTAVSEAIFMVSNGSGSNEFLPVIDNSNFDVWVDNVRISGVTPVTTSGGYYHLAGTRSGSSIVNYVNGAEDVTATDADALSFSTCPLIIGADSDTGCTGSLADWMDGVMDEIRIASTSRTSAWVAAEYVNQNDTNGFYAVNGTPTEWNVSSWTLYDTITIDADQVDDDLTDFPVYVDLADLSATFWSTTPNGERAGYDIRVTTASTSPTELPRELVFASSTLQTGELHFKADSISSTTDTVFRIYYNGTTTGDYADNATYGANNVWTNNFVAVWHMNEDPSVGNTEDSTGNGYIGTPGGTMTSDDLIASRMGRALDFDGIDDELDMGTTLDLRNSFTISGLIQPQTADAVANASVANNIVIKGGETGDPPYNKQLSVYDSNGDPDSRPILGWFSESGATNNYGGSAGHFMDYDEWHYIAAGFNGTSLTLHQNGSVVDGPNGIGNPNADTTRTFAIASGDGLGEYFDGYIDELRLASVDRDTAWVQAEQVNQWSATDFYTVNAVTIPEWNDTDWTLYDTITIDATQVDDDLTDFPVYVDLADLSATFWATTPGAATTTGTDIRVTNNDGSPVELPRELVFASSTAQTGELHFKADSISSTTNTTFRIYYNGTTTGDYADSDTYGTRNVWTNDFVAVYHLNEDGNSGVQGYEDSTANLYHGSGNSMASTSDVSAKIGAGQNFDNTADYINLPPGVMDLSSATSEKTIQAWINVDSATDKDNPIISGRSTDTGNTIFTLTTGYNGLNNDDTGYPSFITRDNGGVGLTSVNGSQDVTDSGFRMVHLTRNSSKLNTIYLDGTSHNSGSDTMTGALTGNFSAIGAERYWIQNSAWTAEERYLDGIVDEVRIASTSRSAAWVSAEYVNQATTTYFYTVNGTPPAGPIAWNENSWTLYDTITIDSTQVDDDLTDFPVYVDLADLSATFWATTPGAATTTGTDIRVTNNDGSPVELPRELVFASSTLQTGELHFKADSISSTTDTVFRIYYNGTTTGDYATDATYGAQNVWTNDYVAVFHLQEDVSDSLGVYDGTTNGAVSYVDSNLTSGLRTDSSSEYFSTSEMALPSAYTVSAWSNFPLESGTYRTLVQKVGGTYHHVLVNSDGELGLYNSAFYSTGYDVDNLNPGWHHITAVASGATTDFYVDSIDVGTSNSKVTQPISAFGNLTAGAQQWGSFDELRVSSSTRSQAWVGAEYVNQYSASDFYTVNETAGGVVWNDTSWTLYDTITIDSTEVDDDLTDFPVYVDLADLSASFWSTTPGAATTTGTDIRVTNNDGSPVELPRELVFASSTLQTGELHFKADSISSTTDTVFRIYYNGTTTGDYATDATYGAQNVWTNEYVAVWHLEEGDDTGANYYKDSTQNASHHTLIDADGDTLETTGFLSGSALDLAGDSDYLNALVDWGTDKSDVTISYWSNIATVDTNEAFAFGAVTTDAGGGERISGHIPYSDDVAYWDYGTCCTTGRVSGDYSSYLNKWTYNTFVYRTSPSVLRGIYLDGGLAYSNTTAEEPTADFSSFRIGSAYGDSTPQYLNGAMDEFRIASTSRSAAWISAEHLNQATTTDFYTVNLSEGGGGSGIILSGILYEDTGYSTTSSSKTIAIAIGTSTPSVHSTTTDATSAWSFEFDENETIGTSTPILVWVDGDATTRAALFTKASTSGNNIGSLDLYKDRVIVSHEGTSGTSTTISDLAFYDSDDDSDIQFNASSTANTLIINSLTELRIKEYKTFAPGGAVTINANAYATTTDGAFHVASSSTYTAGGNLTLGGNLFVDENGTFAHNGYTTTFNGTTTRDIDVRESANTANLGALTFANTATTTMLHSATTTDVTINSGAIMTAPGTLTMTGDFTNNGTFNAGEGGVAGETWTTMTMPLSFWLDVTYGNGLFVAVGSKTGLNAIATSPDGVTWTVRTAPEVNYWYGVTYGNGLFVAVGRSIPGALTGIMTSSDGITWSTSTAPSNVRLNFLSITYGNGLFVAVAASTTYSNTVMTSPDGITWTARTAAEANLWQSVTYGNGIFVAVACGYTTAGCDTTAGGNRVMTSPDGINWTARSAAGDDDEWWDVTYGNGIFVAVAYDGTNRVMTSPDGITWTARSAVGDDDSWWDVTYGNGLFVAVSASGTVQNTAMISPNGISWSMSNNIDRTPAVVYGNGRFVGIGLLSSGMTAPAGSLLKLASTSAQTATGTMTGESALANVEFDGSGTKTFSANASTTNFTINTGATVVTPRELSVSGDFTNNGTYEGTTDWQAISAAGDDDSWFDVTYGNGLFVAVGNSGDRVMTSSDGITWTARSAAGDNDSWKGITYGNGLFVAVGDSTGTGDSVMYSSDGVNWSTTTAAEDDDPWTAITYANGLFVAVAGEFDGDDVVMTSTDGINWTTRSAAGDNDNWNDVTYGNGLFVAVSSGAGGDYVMTSPDGITWTARSAAGDNDGWQGVTYGNGLFVAVGQAGDKAMYSSDGINWTTTSIVGDDEWWGEVVYGNGLFVAVSYLTGSDPVATSPDGINWTARSTTAGTDDWWQGVTYANGRFVAVGRFADDFAMISYDSTTTFNGTDQTISGTLDGATLRNVEFSGAGTKTFSNNASTTNFTINTGATAVAPTELTIAGNYNNNGTFDANSSDVEFNGMFTQTATGTLTGTSAFYDITITNHAGDGTTTQSVTFNNAASSTGTFTMSASTSVAFAAGVTTTLQNIVLTGSTTGKAWIRSTSPGTQSYFELLGSQSVTYVNVKDSNACGGNEVLANDGTSYDAGNNDCWNFDTSTLTMSSADNQTLYFGNPTTTIETITITEGGTPAITAANDIRIKIATSSVNMLFDYDDTTAVFGGTASGKVSNPVSYEGNGSVLVIPVDTDFDAADTLTISGLSFAQFTGTTSSPINALTLYTGGSGDTTADATDTATIGIEPTLYIDAHSNGQVANNFDATNNTAIEILAFSFDPRGESINVDTLVFDITGIRGVEQADVTNVALYRDLDSSETVTAGDTQVGGAGAVSIGGKNGTLTFSTTFESTTTQDYILVADVASTKPGDAMNVVLNTNTQTATKASGGAITPQDGDRIWKQHQRGGYGSGGSSQRIGGSAPEGDGQVGGGQEGGGGGIDPNTGDTIGNSPNFNAPSANGTPNNGWTNGANAYSSDGAYTTATSDGLRQSYTSFGHGVPGSNEITGIAVKIEMSASTNAGDIGVRLSWDGGTSWTSTATSSTASITDAVYTLGGASDLWGRGSWSPTETTDGNFAIDIVSNVTGNTLQVDAIQVRVYHQTTGGGAGGGGGI